MLESHWSKMQRAPEVLFPNMQGEIVVENKFTVVQETDFEKSPLTEAASEGNNTVRHLMKVTLPSLCSHPHSWYRAYKNVI